MIKDESKICNDSGKYTNVSDLNYLNETMGRKKHLIKEIIDVFLEQIPEELESINIAITKIDYPIIKNLAHSMKSSVSIMGISILAPILQEMEDLGGQTINIEKIMELNYQLNVICKKAIEEIERDKHIYA